jgi:hypothetical protein
MTDSKISRLCREAISAWFRWLAERPFRELDREQRRQGRA